MQHIEAILKDLSLVLPDFNVKELSLEKLLTWDIHDLEKQYKEDTLMISFFKLVLKDAEHLELVKTDQLKDKEAELYSIFKASEERATETAIAKKIAIDVESQAMRTILRDVQHRVSTLEGIVFALDRKWTAVTMVAAREKAELQSGLR